MLDRSITAAPRHDGEPAHSAAPPVLLSTKLQPPGRQRDLVDRSALLDLLRTSDHKLVLVDAPAGWGKTTLVSAWATDSAERRPFAWLTLDPADNDAVRFWSYLIEAVRTVTPEVGDHALASLQAPGASVVDHTLPHLVNDLATSRPMVLVLDDFHLIVNSEIMDAVEFLVERLPATSTMVLTTRSDPRLPLARLRARGEMLEIRTDDLRFTAEETARLLNQIRGLHLVDSEVQRIHQRTEGWAAGLCLAALSLKRQSDAARFIAEFAGNDRHIVDFLGSEVLGGLAPDMRDFLLRMSILDKFCAPLCDAVLGRAGSGEMLERVERTNLFLVPLDRTRTWFRFHQLFGELLRHELRESDASSIPELHARACEWHCEQGSISVAIHHATSAGDTARAAQLITDSWYDYLQRGRLQTVSSWLDALGPEVVGKDPRLCLTKAWLGINSGEIDELHRWIEAAEVAAAAGRVREGLAMVTTGTASLRAIHRYMSGDLNEAVNAGHRALELERGGQTSPWHPIGCPVLGLALFWSGRTAEARAELRQAVDEAIEGGNNLSQMHALGGLAAISAEEGQLQEAHMFASTAESVGVANGLGDHWAATLSLVVKGLMLEKRGDLEDAAAAIARAAELSERGIAKLEIAFSKAALARIRRLEGRFQEAAELHRLAWEAIEECPHPGILAMLLERSERSLRLARKGEGGLPPRDTVLSDREREVLRFLPGEYTQREIASALYVSPNTVKTHLKTIFRKLDASSRREAVINAQQRGLL